MVIDGNNSINSGNIGSNRSKQTVSDKTGQTAPVSTDNTPQAQDNVSLSQQGQNLSKLEANIQASSDVNEERVAALKKAIANGSYQVNAERIASQLLDQDKLFS